MRLGGASDDELAGARAAPFWDGLLALAPTLAYDAAVLGDDGPPSGPPRRHPPGDDGAHTRSTSDPYMRALPSSSSRPQRNAVAAALPHVVETHDRRARSRGRCGCYRLAGTGVLRWLGSQPNCDLRGSGSAAPTVEDVSELPGTPCRRGVGGPAACSRAPLASLHPDGVRARRRRRRLEQEGKVWTQRPVAGLCSPGRCLTVQSHPMLDGGRDRLRCALSCARRGARSRDCPWSSCRSLSSGTAPRWVLQVQRHCGGRRHTGPPGLALP
jgi:hypothetical protein